MERSQFVASEARRSRESSATSRRTRYSSIEECDGIFAVQNTQPRWSGNSRGCLSENNMLSVEVDGTIMGEVSSFHTLSGVTNLEFSADVNKKVPKRDSRVCHYGQWKKEVICLVIMFVLVLVGVLTVAIFKNHQSNTYWIIAVHVFRIIRAAGIFGFVGGLANWICIKLVFDRLSWLPCSGILTRHYVDLRESVKAFVMGTLFQHHHLSRYADDKLEQVLGPEHVDRQIQKILECETVDSLIKQKLDFLMGSQKGLILQQAGITKKKLLPFIKPYLLGLKRYIRPLLLSASQLLNLTKPEKLREQIADVISTRSHELAPKNVKKILKDALYCHLSTVVVWGCVMGAFTGSALEIARVCIEIALR